MIVFTIISCASKAKYFENKNALSMEDITQIEFRNSMNQACQKDFEEFEITKRESINEFVTIMNNAKLDGPWKGACFKQINLIMKDSVITISTNGEVFGHGSSGIFYRFPEPELIEQYRIK